MLVFLWCYSSLAEMHARREKVAGDSTVPCMHYSCDMITKIHAGLNRDSHEETLHHFPFSTCYSSWCCSLIRVIQGNWSTLTVLVTTTDALGHFKQDNDSTVGGDGGCRVGEVRTGTTSPMPDYKGLTVRDPPTPFLSEFSGI